MDGFADMTHEQLLQTCARLESRGQMQLTLLSNLEEERSALQAQRDLLRRRIFEVQEEARTPAVARPETGWWVYSLCFSMFFSVWMIISRGEQPTSQT